MTEDGGQRMTWTCQKCGASALDGALVECPECFTPRPRGETPAPPTGVGGARYGWRLTLPNHTTIPLTEGAVTVGRDSPGVIGGVLQYFPHVHREHLKLNVRADSLDYTVPKRAANPVFQYYPGNDEPERLDLDTPIALDAQVDNERVFCLGQCCFIRIDRGEA